MFQHDLGSYLMTRDAVEFMAGRSPEFGQFYIPDRCARGWIRSYPNGALQTEGAQSADELLRILTLAQVLGRDLIAHSQFRSLSPFPRHLYQLVHSGLYDQRVGETGVVIVPTSHARELPGERCLDDLFVAVEFRRRQNKKTMNRFIEVVRSWASSVSQNGIFSEGPAFLATQVVVFQGLQARFRINLGLSGQDTLNWLSLLIIDYGLEVNPINTIVYGLEEGLEEYLSPVHGEPLSLTFGEVPHQEGEVPHQEPVGSLTSIEHDSRTHIPREADPHPLYRSQRFRVLMSRQVSTEDLFLTVYFSRPPSAEEQVEFHNSLKSWIRVGFSGGFGHPGFHNCSEILFAEESASAHLQADMGGADPNIALPVLIRILEGFDSGQLHVEAIIFGRLIGVEAAPSDLSPVFKFLPFK